QASPAARGEDSMRRVAVLCLLMTACKVGPNYERPPAPMSESYKNIDGWKIAEPSDDQDRGPWWAVFNDPVLSELEAQVEISNQNLKQAEGAYREALGVLQQSKASIFPAPTLNGSVRRTSGAVGTTVGGTTVGTGAVGGGARTVYNA